MQLGRQGSGHTCFDLVCYTEKQAPWQAIDIQNIF